MLVEKKRYLLICKRFNKKIGFIKHSEVKDYAKDSSLNIRKLSNILKKEI